METSPETLKQTVYPEGYSNEVINGTLRMAERERADELLDMRIAFLEQAVGTDEYEEAYDRALEMFSLEQVGQLEKIAALILIDEENSNVS